MSESQPDHESTIQEFLGFLRSAACEGALGSDPAAKPQFVPIDRITERVQDTKRLLKLLEALFRNREHNFYPEIIQKDFPRVFCTLLSIGRATFIENFIEDSLSDKLLPFREKPPQFPIATEAPDFWDSFEKKQWMFCPATFENSTPKLRFEEKLILPIIHKEKITEGGSAAIHKIQIHPAYNRLRPYSEDLVQRNLNHQVANTFVLKTYRTKDAKRYYDSEVYGFSKLNSGGRSEPTIIGFYGSFTQNDTFNVPLEYADVGNLEQYFQNPNISPPSKGEEIESFWSKLLNITRAISCIHNVEQGDSVSPKIFQGWHQDIKPANILVMSNGQNSPYMYDFKLADLGLSHFRKHVPSEGDALDKDTCGTRTYGPPECWRADAFSARTPLRIQQKADIWSFACVLSEAAVWIVHGRHGLQEYRQRRKAETGLRSSFEDSDCFHNGERVLNAVKQTHESLETHIRRSDHITQAVWKSMIREMLVDVQSRPDAFQSYNKTRLILEDARGRGTTNQSSTSEVVVAVPPSTLPESPIDRRRSQLTPLHMKEVRRTLPPAGPAYQPAPTTRGDRAQTWDPNCVPPNVLRGSNTWRPRLRSSQEMKSTLPISGQASRPRGGKTWAEDEDDQMCEFPSDLDDISGLHPARFGCLEEADAEDVRSGQCRTKEGRVLVAEGPVTSPTTTQSPVDTLERPFSAIPGSVREAVPEDQIPKLSLDDAQKWKQSKKSKSKDAKQLPSTYWWNIIKGRDHAFLIDNSSSMRQHWSNVLSLLEVLAYIAKLADPDKLDLYFSMPGESSKNKKCKTTTELVKAVESMRPNGPSSMKSDMNASIGSIIGNYQNKLDDRYSSKISWRRMSGSSVRPLSLYVLTDGVWQPNCSLDNTINSLVEMLKRFGLQGSQVGLQFVRFGNDEEGKTRLDHLDRLDRESGLKMDIIDTEPFDSCNIWKIFLGPINRWFDDDHPRSSKQQELNTRPANDDTRIRSTSSP